MSVNIAIDGPAGAGKSTIAKLLAKKYGYVYVDTGAMYRALALYFVENNVALHDEKAVEGCLDAIEVSIAYQDGTQHIFLNGRDVSSEIRQEEIGNAASTTSVYPEVRKKLLSLQRDMAANTDCVMDGRDIGSFVLPDAQVKIFLTASVETRAKRRYNELLEKNEPADLEKISQDIIERDERDMNRKIAPLVEAEDAHRVDSSAMSIDEVVHTISEIVDKVNAR